MDASMMTALQAMAAVIAIIFGMAVLILAESILVSWSLRRWHPGSQDSGGAAGRIQR